MVYCEVMITICSGWKRRELIPRSDGESEPRYNAEYLVEMYSTHKQTISWRCIQHTSKLSRGEVFKTQAISWRCIQQTGLLLRTEDFSTQNILQTYILYTEYIVQTMYSTLQDILLSGCIQHCRIFCSVDVFNTEYLVLGEACNPDYPVEKAY